jgi:glutamate decarboxylase
VTLHHIGLAAGEDAAVAIPWLAREEEAEVPRLRLPEGSLDPRSAYLAVHDELLLDGNPRLNLATFVTTWMEPEAHQLIGESVDKNLIDKDEYPRTAELERRCVNILADLWHGRPEHAMGCSTTGSSEACMLAGLALERRWRARRAGSAGTAADTRGARPNLVFGANVQVVWEKFCRYWDVEPRAVAIGGGATHLTPDGAAAACDENTIGVVAILGSTFDGSYEPSPGSPRRSTACRSSAGSMSPCTSTRPAAASSRRSSTLTSSGTSGWSACCRSTPPATSTASSIRASAGRSGARRARCRRSSCSASTTSAATCRRSR